VPTTTGEGRNFLLSWFASERLVPSVRVRNKIVRNQDIVMRFEFSEMMSSSEGNAKLYCASK